MIRPPAVRYRTDTLSFLFTTHSFWLDTSTYPRPALAIYRPTWVHYTAIASYSLPSARTPYTAAAAASQTPFVSV